MEKNLKVYVKTFGCSLNQADGEIIKGYMENAGFKLTRDYKEAGLVIYNTCGVKQSTEDKIIFLLKKVRGKKLIVTGCLPLINLSRIRREVPYDALVGPSPGEVIVDVAKKVLENKGGKVELLRTDFFPNCLSPRKRKNPLIEIIPICLGCTGKCSYCAVKLARGKLRSYYPETILEKVKASLKDGCRELWFTAQDVASYGRDIGFDLPYLLKKATSLKGKFRIRIGMMNPGNLKDILNELIRTYESEKIYKFVHLPVQSGSDNVLKDMKRNYTKKDFIRVIDSLKASFPEVSITTDVIVGFPTEDENDFEETIQLIEKVKPDKVNISKFSPKKGTEASKLKKLPTHILKKRSKTLAEICREISLEKNLTMIGKVYETLITSRNLGEDTLKGRTPSYKPVTIESENTSLLGKFVKVRIVDATYSHLIGCLEE